MSRDFFPPVYEDEDIRSIVYRYQAAREFKVNISSANQQLFNRASNTNSAFPCNVSKLVSLLQQSNFSLDDFIKNHTYLPLAKYCLDQSRYQELDHYVKYGDPSSRRDKVNASVTGFLSAQLMYCPLCLADDYSRGEAYIHRSHQVDFIPTCHIHEIDLISECSHCHAPFSLSKQLWRPICRTCGAHIAPSGTKAATESTELAKDLNYLMNTSVSNSREIKERLILFGVGTGFINRNGGHYNNKLILSELENQIMKLGFRKEDIVEFRSQKHFAYTAINSGSVRIFILLLLMRLFAGDAKKFINDDPPRVSTPIYFGNGPWSCINHYCKFYNIPNVTHCERKYCHTTKTFVGQFECAACGQIYINRSNTTGSIIEQQKVVKRGSVWKGQYLTEVHSKQLHGTRGRIKYYTQTHGKHVINVRKQEQSLEWFGLIIEQYQESNNYNQVARSMKIGNRLVKKLVSFYREHGENIEAFRMLPYCDAHTSWKLENLKANVDALLQEKGELTRTQIMKAIGQKSYDFLLAHDAEWVNQSLKNSFNNS